MEAAATAILLSKLFLKNMLLLGSSSKRADFAKSFAYLRYFNKLARQTVRGLRSLVYCQKQITIIR